MRVLGFMKDILVLHTTHTSFTLLSLLLCTYQCTPAGTVNTFGSLVSIVKDISYLFILFSFRAECIQNKPSLGWWNRDRYRCNRRRPNKEDSLYWTCANAREYRMIYIGPSWIAFILSGSSPPPPPLSKLSLFLSLPVCRRSSLLMTRGRSGRKSGPL